MIEQGFVELIQSAVSSLAPGGFAVQLPKDQVSASSPMAWTYRSVNSTPNYVLEGQDPFTGWTVQVDCHGYAMKDAITLARAIDNALSGGYSGTLTDPDSTVVLGIFSETGPIDGYSDANRTYVRSLEYLVNFYQQVS